MVSADRSDARDDERMDDTIGPAWTAAVAVLGGAPGDSGSSGRELLARYAEPHRRYHGPTHVAAVLRDAAWLGERLSLDAGETAVVTLAACAHDVVYDARPGVDERASARWAATALTAAGLSDTDVAEVVRLVLATLAHEVPPTDRVGAVLLDADLAILAADPAGYDVYLRDVRAEYSAVSDAEWRTGRATVLRGLLERDALFVTGPGRARWEAAAQANVARELADLED